jgi:hypothetical protein
MNQVNKYLHSIFTTVFLRKVPSEAKTLIEFRAEAIIGLWPGDGKVSRWRNNRALRSHRLNQNNDLRPNKQPGSMSVKRLTCLAGEFANSSNPRRIPAIARCWKAPWPNWMPCSHAWAKSRVWFVSSSCHV